MLQLLKCTPKTNALKHQTLSRVQLEVIHNETPFLILPSTSIYTKFTNYLHRLFFGHGYWCRPIWHIPTKHSKTLSEKGNNHTDTAEDLDIRCLVLQRSRVTVRRTRRETAPIIPFVCRQWSFIQSPTRSSFSSDSEAGTSPVPYRPLPG